MSEFKVGFSGTISRVMTAGLFSLSLFCGCSREEVSLDEKLPQPEYDRAACWQAFAKEKEFGILKELREIIWGNGGKKGLEAYTERRFCAWLSSSLNLLEDEQVRAVLEKNSDLVAFCFKNEKRKNFLLKAVAPNVEQSAYLDRLVADGEKRLKSKKEEDSVRASLGEFDADVLVRRLNLWRTEWEWTWEAEPDLREENFDHPPIYPRMIESEIARNYELRGKANVAENGDYDLVYVLPDKRLLVCPMSGDNQLRADAYIKEVPRITLIPRDEAESSWIMKFSES